MGRLKRALVPLVIVLVAILVVVVLAGIRPEPGQQPRVEPVPPEIPAMKARPVRRQVSVLTQGTVKPKVEVALAAQVAGQVMSVSANFVDGGFFSEGEVLLQLDSRDYDIEVIRASSRVAEAEKTLAMERGQARQAKREWRDLGNREGNALFLREPQLKAAEAALAGTRADLEQARINLERTTIVAPFDGLIRQTQVNQGQYVSSGTQVAEIFATHTMAVRLPLTASQASRLSLPLRPEADSPLQVTLSARFNGQQANWPGLLVRTDATVDTRSRVIYGIVEVTNPYQYSPPLVAGLFVNAEVAGRSFDAVVRVPRQALYEKDQLLVLDEENRLRTGSVRVLQVLEESLLITGIPEGQLILLERPGYIVEGMKVSPVLVSAPDLP
ncbi:efflux RND transporter periplasmic adaptor subunit [uncultured Porticoccus sp.]|uniref:efflux RND transporter periplasmic adaptor subunit n=1 Tax=uncultured Porticoccus sp. TaxID=1256050 RepID=UPI002630ECE9|nr:efflux RND transporter periplasmic adaptor subunit [uncultured Porticoccus sp.]